MIGLERQTMKDKTKQMKKNAGFTLVELIAVMAILAILLMVAVPKMTEYIEASHRAAARTEAQLTADAVQRYLNDEFVKGTLDGKKLTALMGQELNNPDGVLWDYIHGGQKGAKLYYFHADQTTGRLYSITYESEKYRIEVTIDEDGNRTLKEVEK